MGLGNCSAFNKWKKVEVAKFVESMRQSIIGSQNGQNQL
jgi:hypothetical protein